MGEAGVDPGSGAALEPWSNNFARNRGSLERKQYKKGESDGYSDTSECEMTSTDLCLLISVHMSMFLLPLDSSFLILSFFLRNLVVSKATPCNESNRTTPICHTVEVPAL